MSNLIAGIMKELERNRELLKLYEAIPTGTFGAILLRQKIRFAEKAIETGDTVAMVEAYNELVKSE